MIKASIVRAPGIEPIRLAQIGIIALHSLIAANPAHGKGVVSIEAAINSVSSHERLIRTAEWDATTVGGHVEDVSKANTIQLTHDPGAYSKSHVIYEPLTGRFRVDTESEFGSGIGTRQVAVYRTETFDGQVRRSFVHRRDGDRLPDNENHKDKLGRVQIRDLLKPSEWSLPPGIAHFPPNFLGKQFSVFLRERLQKNLPLKVSEMPGGTWQFETLADDYAETGCVTRIEYEPARGIVLNAEWWATSDSDYVKRLGRLWKRMVFSWKEVSPRLWVPQSVFQVHVWDKSANRFEYSNVRVNFDTNESVFRFQFPDGTDVVDDTERKVYRVSPEGFDDQAAREEYDRRQNPFEYARQRHSSRPGTRILPKAVVILILLVAVIASGISWRKRRRARSQTSAPQ